MAVIFSDYMTHVPEILTAAQQIRATFSRLLPRPFPPIVLWEGSNPISGQYVAPLVIRSSESECRDGI